MITVTAAILMQDDKVLLTRRKKHDTMGGFWEFPGGGVDEGETPDQCMVRELSEELGIIARPISLFDAAATDDRRIVVLFYFCEFEGNPQPLDCDEMRWVPVAQIPDYSLLPLDLPIARKLADRFIG